MFGEYNDLDICGMNRGGFDDPSDESSYTFDSQSDAGASISDDYLDTFDSKNAESLVQDEPVEQEQPVVQESVESEFAEELAQNEEYSLDEEPVQEELVYNEDFVQNDDEFVQNDEIIQDEEPQPDTRSSLSEPPKSSVGLYIVALVLLVVIAAGMFIYKKNSQPSAVNDTQAMGEYFYDKATEGNPEQVELPQIEVQQPVATETMATVDVDLTTPQVSKNTENVNIAQNKNSKADEKDNKPGYKSEKSGLKPFGSAVVIPVAAGGRVDPFKPFNEVARSLAASKPKFDIVAPPLEVPETDPMIDTLMEAKITGIMYDDVRPSAIIVVDGSEQLVHKNDVVSGYKILNITRNKVVMKYKNNVYELSAGQSLAPDGVHINPVSSLSKQFGGAYTNTPKNVIQFN